MLCELCGKRIAELNAVVEGSMLSICKDCSKFGKVVEVKKSEIDVIKEKMNIKREKPNEYQILDIIEANYAERIKNARERKGLTQKDLATQVGEKESVIRNLENGHLELSFELAKRLEKILEIKVMSKPLNIELSKEKVDMGNEELTIGDLLKRI